jgi:hypothetical protein
MVRSFSSRCAAVRPQPFKRAGSGGTATQSAGLAAQIDVQALVEESGDRHGDQGGPDFL